MKMTDDEIQNVGSALYQILGAHDASEEALDLALALAQDDALPFDPLDLLPYTPGVPWSNDDSCKHQWVANSGQGGLPVFKPTASYNSAMHVMCSICGSRTWFTETDWDAVTVVPQDPQDPSIDDDDDRRAQRAEWRATPYDDD